MDIQYNDNVTKVTELLKSNMFKESMFNSAQCMFDLARETSISTFTIPNGATKEMATLQTNELADAVVFSGEVYRRIANFISDTMVETFGQPAAMEVVAKCIDSVDVSHFAGHGIDSPRNALLFSMVETAIIAKVASVMYTFQDFTVLSKNLRHCRSAGTRILYYIRYN